MNELFGKLSIYEILNNFLPGILICGYALLLFNIPMEPTNVISIIFICCLFYFTGLLISRLGSLILQPLARKTNFIVWNKAFFEAEKHDEKITILLRDMNLYRTLSISAFAAFILTIISCCRSCISLNLCLILSITMIFISIIFLLSYRKQSKAINSRIKGAQE